MDVPTNAESVHFTGELVADFMPVPGALTNGLQRWEVKLQWRVIGLSLLVIGAFLAPALLAQLGRRWAATRAV